MNSKIKLFSIIGVSCLLISTPIIVSVFKKEETRIHMLGLDAEHDKITVLNLEEIYPSNIYGDKPITISIKNFFGSKIKQTGYTNKQTIIVSGNVEKMTIYEWAEYMFRLTPRGGV